MRIIQNNFSLSENIHKSLYQLSLRAPERCVAISSENTRLLRFARNDTREARNDKSGVVSNEKGIALVMVLILSVIALAIMAGLIYMVTSGTQMSGMEKRYKTALEAGSGGADVQYQIIALRMDNPASLVNEFSFLNSFSVPISQQCLNDKLLHSTADWTHCPAAMSEITTGPTSFDMSFELGATPTFTVYTKIVDTVEGNSGGDEGLRGKGVVASGTGEIEVVHRPYLYSIEVDSENAAHPSERAKLSILYQY